MTLPLLSPAARYENFCGTWPEDFTLPAWDDAAGHPLRELFEIADAHPRGQDSRRTQTVVYVDLAMFYDFSRALTFVRTLTDGVELFEVGVNVNGSGKPNAPIITVTLLVRERTA